MSWSSSLRLLQTAIENVREECDPDKYKTLFTAIDAADTAAEKALGEPDDSTEDKARERQPRDLKGASALARKEYARVRATDSDSSK